jgi:MFS family permease
LNVSKKWQALIRDGWSSGSEYASRSELDAAAMVAMLEAGHTEWEILAVFTDTNNGIGEKFRDEGTNGVHYLHQTLASAKDWTTTHTAGLPQIRLDCGHDEGLPAQEEHVDGCLFQTHCTDRSPVWTAVERGIGGHARNQAHVPLSFRSPTFIPIAVVVFFNAAWHAVIPYVALYASSLGMSVGQIGVLLSTQVVASFVASVASMRWIEAFSPRALALGASLAGSGSMLLMAVWPDPSAAFLGLTVLGAAQTIMSVACQVVIARHTKSEQYVRIWTVYSFFISLALVCGPALGAASIPLAGSVRGPFFVATGFIAVAGALAWFIRDGAQSKLPPMARFLTSLRAVPPPVHFGLITGALAEFCYAGWVTFFPLLLKAAGQAEEVVGLLFALSGVATAAIRPILTRVVLPASQSRAVALSFVLLAVGSGFALGPALLPLAILASLCFGLGFGLVFPMTLVLVTAPAPSELASQLLGARLITGKLGQMLGPPLLSLFARLHLAAPLVVVGTISAAMVPWILARGHPYQSSKLNR